MTMANAVTDEERKETRAAMRVEAIQLDADNAAHEIAAEAFSKMTEAVIARSPGGMAYGSSKIPFENSEERTLFIKRMGNSFHEAMARFVTALPAR